MAKKINVGDGWVVEVYGEDYIYITKEDTPGEIQVKAEDEGFVVDIFADGDDALESVATTYATYEELKGEAE